VITGCGGYNEGVVLHGVKDEYQRAKKDEVK